jgi:cytochrome oxidase Cu insertion factor (SCO1/SenC/PrrC family)
VPSEWFGHHDLLEGLLVAVLVSGGAFVGSRLMPRIAVEVVSEPRKHRYDRRMLEEGKPAPNFSLPSDAGETVSLESLRGKPIVLYFYPKDDSP